MKIKYFHLVAVSSLFAITPAGAAVKKEATALPDKDINFSLAPYYSRNLQDQDSAYFDSKTGVDFLVSKAVTDELSLNAVIGVYREIDGFYDDTQVKNAVITGSLTLPDINVLNTSIGQSTSVSVILPTNKDDADYSSYNGGFNGSYKISYSLDNLRFPVSLFGDLGLSESMHEYDTNKGGKYNTRRVLKTSAGVSVELPHQLNLDAVITNRNFWLTDGTRDTDSFSHSLGITYKYNDKLELSLSESLSDRTFEYDEVSSNVNIYDDRLTTVTGTVTYTL